MGVKKKCARGCTRARSTLAASDCSVVRTIVQLLDDVETVENHSVRTRGKNKRSDQKNSVNNPGVLWVKKPPLVHPRKKKQTPQAINHPLTFVLCSHRNIQMLLNKPFAARLVYLSPSWVIYNRWYFITIMSMSSNGYVKCTWKRTLPDFRNAWPWVSQNRMAPIWRWFVGVYGLRWVTRGRHVSFWWSPFWMFWCCRQMENEPAPSASSPVESPGSP